MMYTTRNRSNDTIESQKEKDLFQCSFSVQSVKQHRRKITCTSQYYVCEHGEEV